MTVRRRPANRRRHQRGRSATRSGSSRELTAMAAAATVCASGRSFKTFLDARKVHSQLDVLACDGAILMSIVAAGKAHHPSEPMPPFMLPDEGGRLVALPSLLERGPVAVMFFRGPWCPCCRLNGAVEEIPDLKRFDDGAPDPADNPADRRPGQHPDHHSLHVWFWKPRDISVNPARDAESRTMGQPGDACRVSKMDIGIRSQAAADARMLGGRVALVTGSTSGIGRGIARALAAAGANGVLNGFGAAEEIARTRDAIARDHGVKILHSAVDVTSPNAIAEMIAMTMGDFGRLDTLVNNAGVQHIAPLEQFPVAKWDRILPINLSSAFHTIRLALPAMREQRFGRITTWRPRTGWPPRP